MQDFDEQLAIAERYLDEMLAAEAAGSYEAWTARFQQRDLVDFTEDVFKAEVEEMSEEVGRYQSREYLGTLKGPDGEDYPQSIRFVWKAAFEKMESVIVVGIHKVDDTWHVHENICM